MIREELWADLLVVKFVASVAWWGCLVHIGNNFIEFDIWTCLNTSQVQHFPTHQVRSSLAFDIKWPIHIFTMCNTNYNLASQVTHCPS